jgi:cytochrome c
MPWAKTPSPTLSSAERAAEPPPGSAALSRAESLAMRFPISMGVLLLCAFFASQQAHADGDPARGEEIYRRCMACHSIEHDLVGPHHAGLFGRKAGSVPDFPYSQAMRNSGIVWGEATLDVFLKNPQARVPGSFMTFAGLPDDGERADVIAYLKEATAIPPQADKN